MSNSLEEIKNSIIESTRKIVDNVNILIENDKKQNEYIKQLDRKIDNAKIAQEKVNMDLYSRIKTYKFQVYKIYNEQDEIPNVYALNLDSY